MLFKYFYIFLQISDNIPLNFLPIMGEKSDLEQYAHYFVRKFMKEKYFIIDSDIYFKKHNLTGDIASWSGWQIIVRDQQRDYVFIHLRRSYIPPIMDSFVDIAVIFIGPKNPIQMTEVPQFPTSQDTIRLAQQICDSVHP